MEKISLLFIIIIAMTLSSAYSDTQQNITRKNPLDGVSRQVANHTTRSRTIRSASKEKRTFYSYEPTANRNCENTHKYSIFSNNLVVSSNNPLKHKLLKEFLSIKFFQHLELINYLTIGEFPRQQIESLSILEIPTQNNVTFDKFGTKKCNLELLAQISLDKRVSVCPWHWVIINREERYPFELPIAECSCVKCQARTLYDTERVRKSSCKQNYSLKPVLFREFSVDGQEVWMFSLEKVPVSCSCSIMLNPF